MAALAHVLRLIRSGDLDVPDPVLDGLEAALDLALDAYAAEGTAIATRRQR